MALSRPIYNLLGVYFEQLFNHPIRTKSITSSVVLASANIASQKIAGNKNINQRSVFAYTLFGLLFGGTVPHYFYQFAEKVTRDVSKAKSVYLLILQQCFYAPLFQLLSLYSLSRFEGKDHDFAVKNIMTLYWPLLQANWTYLTPLVFLNLAFVPPMLRVLVGNFIGFFWALFVAMKRRKAATALSKARADGEVDATPKKQ